MRKTVKKFFGLWDLDKEEKWLNEMAVQGWYLVSVKRWHYEFEQAAPGMYNIRLEFMKKGSAHQDNQRYISFLKETGVIYIGGVGYIAYFAGTTDADFELFSDNTSRINYYSRIIKEMGFWVGFSWLEMLVQVFLFLLNLSNFQPIDVEYIVFAIIWLLIAVFYTKGLVKNIKKRKELREQQNIFE